jgi:hypothetical protein
VSQEPTVPDGTDPANGIRATKAEVAATGTEQCITLTLVGMPRLPDIPLPLSRDDYPPQPLTVSAGGLQDDQPDRPDPQAEANEMRRWLPPLLDRALGLVLANNGPANAASLVAEANGTVTLKVFPLPPRTARALQLPEWIHVLRIINIWLYHGWTLTGRGEYMPGEGLEQDRIAREVNAVAKGNGDSLLILDQVLAQHALRAFNGVLGGSPSQS